MHALNHYTVPERDFFKPITEGGRESVYQHADLQIMFLVPCHLIVSGCSGRWSTRRKLRAPTGDDAHAPSPAIMRESLPLRLNLFVLFFLSGSAAPQKDRHNVAFLEQLVNMTLCPAEQKNASSPCPQWPAHWLHAGSRRGATLVKSEQKSVWNKESHSKKRLWLSTC